jgi:hypothetical protein
MAIAADHGDAPIPSNDQAMDIGDVHAFLDPNDNTKLVVAMTFRGFIVPSEAVNFGFFDHLAQYTFEFETNGDTKPDATIKVKFGKRTATTTPQVATIILPNGKKISGLTTLPNLSSTAAEPTITTDSGTGISFFAGEVDDPFFFDIPAFGRFTASVRAGSPDTTQLQRGRDSFAGYNIQAIALSIPVSFLNLKPAANGIVGVEGLAQRRLTTTFARKELRSAGLFKTIDRMGNPGLNVLVIPFARKNEYNFSTPVQDAKGKFASDIVSTLQGLGANESSINTLASIYVTKGDYLRVNTATANTGNGGGDNTGAGFPNGRRLKDDVVDTFLTVVANGTTLGDSVNANDVTLRNTFPFFAAPQQPRDTGTIDDNTRN